MRETTSLAVVLKGVTVGPAQVSSLSPLAKARRQETYKKSERNEGRRQNSNGGKREKRLEGEGGLKRGARGW